MFKKNKTYKRRYESLVAIDKISDDTVESNGIDSYKPSKSKSIAGACVSGVGDEMFDIKSSCDYANDMDLLNFNSDDMANVDKNNNVVIDDGVYSDVTSSESEFESDKKSTNLLVLVGLAIGVLITVIVHILM